jgi:hypothetical protein
LIDHIAAVPGVASVELRQVDKHVPAHNAGKEEEELGDYEPEGSNAWG